MRDPDNVRAVAGLRPDMMGFIFYDKSAREVQSSDSVSPLAEFPEISRVGVFVNPDLEDVLEKTREYGLDQVQLHGDESPGFCSAVAGFVPVIKAFRIAEKSDFELVNSYAGSVELFLFDAKGKGYGGNGIQFDWSLLEEYRGNTPFLLSGGIGPQDLEAIRRFHHPQCVGIDVNSGFETAPAQKDASMLAPFLANISPFHLNDSTVKR